MQVINPATEQIVAELPTDNQQSVQQKFEMLQAGQKAWRAVSLIDRLKIVAAFHSILERDLESLATILTEEMGKPLQQSRNEINGARSRIQFFIDHSEQYLAQEWTVQSPDLSEKITYEPHGVICNISAWNYPYLVGVNVFVPALIAGNAVFYKPSEHSTLTGLAIEKAWKEAGLPTDVFQTAVGAREVGELLLELPLDGYYFTGSYRTGKYIYEKVATKMVPCQMELGGKDPLYVADDVNDVKNVAIGTADGTFYNNGQSCCAVERIYVHEKVYDEYVAAFVAEVKSWKLGMPTEQGVYLGALARKEQLDLLENQVADALEKGATLLTGGKRIEGKGYFFEPTVLTNVNHTMDVMREESFGPIIGIMKVADDAEAIQLMQDTEYGLTASVYSASSARATNILKELNSGTGYWNCCDRVSAALPWSGRKHSGFGATLSHLGIRAFTKPRGWHFRGAV